MSDAVGAIEPVDVGEVTFAETVDVVVVGLGIAGTCAAIAAAEAGADVLALERGVAAGGTSALSGGLIYLGGGTPVQTACGYEDSAENMERFLLAACGARTDPAKVHAYCAGSVAHYHWLVDHGVPFKGQFNDEPNREPFDDSGLVFSGGEDSWPFTDVADPVPARPPSAVPRHRRRLPDGVPRRRAEHDRGRPADRRTRRSARGRRRRGRRRGRPRRRRGPRDPRARRRGPRRRRVRLQRRDAGALLPAGARARIRRGGSASPTTTGAGVRLGQGAGGALRNMDAVECALPIGPPHRLARAHPREPGRRAVRERGHLHRPHRDARVARAGRRRVHDRERGDLRGQLRRHAAAVGGRDRRPSSHATSDCPRPRSSGPWPSTTPAPFAARTPAWHKLPPWVVPLRAPLGAVDLRVDRQAIYAPFTLGGLATDADGAVLDDAGAPGPGPLRGRSHHRGHRRRRLRERDLARRRQLLRPPGRGRRRRRGLTDPLAPGPLSKIGSRIRPRSGRGSQTGARNGPMSGGQHLLTEDIGCGTAHTKSHVTPSRRPRADDSPSVHARTGSASSSSSSR